METADYTPLDLSSVCNTGADCLQDAEALPTGRQTFHGIPFQIGSPGGEEQYCLIRLAGHDGTLSIKAGDSTARHVLFAHRQLASQLLNGGSLGEVVAHYTLHYADGGSTLIPIRERSRQDQPGMVTHAHGEADHQAFLERPFQEALAALHARMHRSSVLY